MKANHPPLEQLAQIKVQAVSADMSRAKDEFVLSLDGAFKVDIRMRNLDEDKEEEPGALLPLPEEGKKSYEAFTMKIKPRQASGKATLAVPTLLDIWEKTKNGYVLVTKRTWDLSKEALPTRLYAEPVKSGIGWLELTYHPGDGRVFSDKVKVTVFKINLIVQNLPEETNPTPHEMDPGAKILLDNDDDNGNGIRDLKEDKTVAGENDLVAAKIEFEPDVTDKLTEGTLRLRDAGGAGEGGTARHLKIWKDKDKSEQFSSYRFGPDGDGGEVPDEVYLEGIRGGTTELKLSFGAAADRVKVGIYTVGLDLDVDSNNDGEIDSKDELLEEKSPGFILPIGTEGGPYPMKLHMTSVDETLGHHWPKPEIVTITQRGGDDNGELKIYDDNNHEITPETNLFSSLLQQNRSQTFKLVGEKPGEVELTVQYGKDKIVIAEDKVVVRVVDVDMRTDLNRDGKIDFGDDGDSTSAAKPWRFWINNDCDRAEKDVEEDIDPSSNSKDYLDDVIGCKRDLEDFSLLHLKIKGFSSKDVGSGKLSCHLRFDPLFGGLIGSRDFNLFHFPIGSPAYLTDEKVAGRIVRNSGKLKIPNSDYYGEFILKPGILNNMEATFLFEGKKEGKGTWTVKVFYDNMPVLTRSLVHTEIFDIKNMYEHYYE